jgi:hypothetical protein
MKKYVIMSVLLFSFYISNAQRLTLPDLINLCNKKNWETVNQILSAKGWTYFNSKKGDSSLYGAITWSYIKQEYSDKAQGWIFLFTSKNVPEQLSYNLLVRSRTSLFKILFLQMVLNL